MESLWRANGRRFGGEDQGAGSAGGRLPDEPVVFVMMADPDPDEIVAIFQRERSMASADPRLPAFADFLELRRGMRLIPLEQLEILFGELLYGIRQGVKTIPELKGRPVHLQIPKLAFRLGFHGFPLQEIQLAGSGIRRDLPVPLLPLARFYPLPELLEVLLGQGGYFGLNAFQLCHRVIS
jgi:hypothetical protein